MYTQQFFVEGLACASYLVGCESHGVAAIVDPDRDTRKYIDAAQARGLNITHIIETHLHADHVSGNTDLAQRTGADIYIHEQAMAEFPHIPLKEGQMLWLGNTRLDILHTPGHTPDSVTLLVSDTSRGQEPWLAFTGDTLFVGDIGRPDLVGAEAARQLAADMHASLFERVLKMDDGLMIYPGHGAGSLCGKSIAPMRSTTLGFERRHNPALEPRDREAFVEFATRNMPEQPGNHQRIKAINRRGPAPLGEIEPRPLSIRAALPYFERGAGMLDTRSKEQFVLKHVPGAAHLEADDQLSNRVAFVLPAELPLVLVVEREQEYLNVFYSLARVGYENVIGYLAESLEAWDQLGLPVVSGDIEELLPDELHELLSTEETECPLVLDVREPWEYQRGHVPGAVLIPLGQLAQRAHELDPSRPVAVICSTGSRSQSAAALLGRLKFNKVYNVASGTQGWANQGFPIEK
ncbi:MAG TPA: MBL fold metallo-hydrolase [Anaerolineales bacterium]|nr:MBL fold metallo-hydrolase [Anaerolineales bacterium]